MYNIRSSCVWGPEHTHSKCLCVSKEPPSSKINPFLKLCLLCLFLSLEDNTLSNARSYIGFDSAVIVLTLQCRCVSRRACVCVCVCWIPDSPRGSRPECSTAIFHFDTLIDTKPFPSHCAPPALPLRCTSHYCYTKGNLQVGIRIVEMRCTVEEESYSQKATPHVAFFFNH